jgi:hypothetical protein
MREEIAIKNLGLRPIQVLRDCLITVLFGGCGKRFIPPWLEGISRNEAYIEVCRSDER